MEEASSLAHARERSPSPFSSAPIDPSVVCKSRAPFAVVYANSQWEALCGWTSAEMLGRDLRCLQGPATEQAAIARMMQSCDKGEACVIPSLINYDKQGRPFLHEVVVTPLCGADGSVELIRATSRSVRRLQSSCGNGDVSIDVQGGEGLDERDGRGSVDTTVAALAAVICQKRARDQSPAFQRAITTSVPPSLSMPCPVVSMVVLTAPKPPYEITWASPDWLGVCGFALHEITGSNLKCIQGPSTDPHKIGRLMDRMARGENCVIEGLINYDKKRRPFQHTLTVIAVGADGVDVARSGHDVAMLRAVSTDVSLSKEGIFDRSAGCTAQEELWSEEWEEFQSTMG